MLDFPPLLASELQAGLLLAWLFAVGACIGSFMNVVIYRLPAGLSLLHPPSRCPVCKTPIRATDNVPIFGWILLGGRCRSCTAEIPPRYPAVELLAALVFVSLAWVEPLSGGRNLPPAAANLTPGELWGIYAFHLFLLCSLISAAFTEFDGHRLTWRLTLPALVVGLALPIVCPHLRPAGGALGLSPSWGPVVDGLAGAAAGTVLGYCISFLKNPQPNTARLGLQGFREARKQTRRLHQKAGDRRVRKNQKQRSHPVLPGVAIPLAWVGVFLGWPAAAALAATSLITTILLSLFGRYLPAVQRVGPIACLAPWTFIWIVLSRGIDAVIVSQLC